MYCTPSLTGSAGAERRGDLRLDRRAGKPPLAGGQSGAAQRNPAALGHDGFDVEEAVAAEIRLVPVAHQAKFRWFWLATPVTEISAVPAYPPSRTLHLRKK